MLYKFLKVFSCIISHFPYFLVVKIGKTLGRLYYYVAKKQRVRAQQTMEECLKLSEAEADSLVRAMCRNLGMTILEIFYMSALKKENIDQYVHFEGAEVLLEELKKNRGVILLTCHMGNWEWLGATVALHGFQMSAPAKNQPNQVYFQFMNELRRGVGQEILTRGTSEILGCARALKRGKILGLVADQDGGYDGIFVPFFGKMASCPAGPVYFARKFKAPIIPVFIIRNENDYGHRIIVDNPIYYEDTGNREADDYRTTVAYTQRVEKVIREYPSGWLWFQHRWNTPYEEAVAKRKEAATRAAEGVKA